MQIVAVVVFVVAMVAIMSEKVHRALVAIVGAMILLVVHVVTFDQAMSHVDFNTLGVLLGMMLFVAVVKLSGIFEYLAIKCARLAKGNPWHVMVLFVCLTALLSALLDNVTTVLLIGPMTITVCRLLDIDAVPFFLAEIMASNIGGTATLIGDPPNIMIGSAAHLTFMDFLAFNGPAIIVIMVVAIAIFYVMYGRNMGASAEQQASIMELHAHEAIKNKSLFNKSVVMIALVAVAFVCHSMVGVEPSVVALTAAAIMLLISRAEVEKILLDVEWATIGFFAGLFIVVGGLAETGVINMLANGLIDITGGDTMITIIVLVWASAIISSFLDNIPMVATLIPILIAMESTGVDVMPYWWAISLGACIGGIGTLIGASANVVLSGMSGRYGYPISFMDYTKVGFPLMLVFTAISCAWLLIRFCVF